MAQQCDKKQTALPIQTLYGPICQEPEPDISHSPRRIEQQRKIDFLRAITYDKFTKPEVALHVTFLFKTHLKQPDHFVPLICTLLHDHPDLLRKLNYCLPPMYQFIITHPSPRNPSQIMLITSHGGISWTPEPLQPATATNSIAARPDLKPPQPPTRSAPSAPPAPSAMTWPDLVRIATRFVVYLIILFPPERGPSPVLDDFVTTLLELFPERLRETGVLTGITSFGDAALSLASRTLVRGENVRRLGTHLLGCGQEGRWLIDWMRYLVSGEEAVLEAERLAKAARGVQSETQGSV